MIFQGKRKKLSEKQFEFSRIMHYFIPAFLPFGIVNTNVQRDLQPPEHWTIGHYQRSGPQAALNGWSVTVYDSFLFQQLARCNTCSLIHTPSFWSRTAVNMKGYLGFFLLIAVLTAYMWRDTFDPGQDNSFTVLLCSFYFWMLYSSP